MNDEPETDAKASATERWAELQLERAQRRKALLRTWWPALVFAAVFFLVLYRAF